MVYFCISQDSFYLSKHADPVEMPHCAVFHLDLHCLIKYLLTGNADTEGVVRPYILARSRTRTYSPLITEITLLSLLISPIVFVLITR